MGKKYLLKILLCVCFIIVISLNVNAGLSDGIQYYYTIDTTNVSGTAVIDSIGANNLTNTGADLSALGIVNEGGLFGSGDKFEAGAPLLHTTANWTFSVWINWTGTSSLHAILAEHYPDGTTDGRFWLAIQNSTNKVSVNINGDNRVQSVNTVSRNVWHHIVISRDIADNYTIYLDGVFENSGKYAKAISVLNTRFGLEDHNGYQFLGTMDEIGIWTRALTQSEVTELYNSGSGSQYPFSHFPIFQGQTPEDGDKNNTQVEINITCSNGNITLWFDNNSNPTNRVINNAISPANWTTNVTISNTYFYKASCDKGLSNSSVRSWIYDIDSPYIIINPNNFFSSINLSVNNQYSTQVLLNVSFTDNIDLYGFQINITKGDTEYWNFTNETIAGILYNFSKIVDVTSFDEGVYNIKILVSDSHTAYKIKDYKIKKGSSYLNYKTYEGNDITIESELLSNTATQKSEDRYSFEFDFTNSKNHQKVFYLRSKTPINYRANSKYKAHFTIWNGKDGNWVDFEGIEGIPIVEKLEDYKQWYFFGDTIYSYKITFNTAKNKLIFSSIGGMNTKTETYQWYRGIATSLISANYTLLSATVYLNTTLDNSINDTNAILTYNGTKYSSPSKSVYNNSIIFSQAINVAEVGSNENKTYIWNISSQQNDSSLSISQVNFTHNIIFWDLGNCTTYTANSINFTLRDENNESSIIGNINADFNFTIGQGIYKQYYVDKTGISNFSICIIPPTADMIGDYFIDYDATYYPQRSYIESSALFDNTPQLINLYLLYYTDGLYIRFRTVNNYQSPIVDVSVEMKKSGETAIIEQKTTDSSGIATFWANPDHDYDFTFSKTGYESVIYSLRPTSTDIYTITMNSETETQQIIDIVGVNYQFSPEEVTLKNNTLYPFLFNISSNQNTISNCTLFIKGTDNNIMSQSSTTFNSSNGNIALNINTGLNETLIAEVIFVVGNTTYTERRIYTVSTYDIGEHSLKIFIDDLTNFSGAGFDNTGRLIVAFIIIIAVTLSVNYKFKGSVNPEGIILLFLMLVGFFSIIGWLYLDFVSIDTIYGFDLKKHIIFILMIMVCSAYIAWRHS